MQLGALPTGLKMPKTEKLNCMARKLSTFICCSLLLLQALPASAEESLGKTALIDSNKLIQTDVNNSSSATDLFRSIINAYGGPEVLQKNEEQARRFQAIMHSTSGLSSASNSYDCMVLQKGNKIRMEAKVLGALMVVGFDGKNSWTDFADWVTINGPIATSIMSETITHGLNILPEALGAGTRLELLPTQQVSGKTCNVLKVTLPSGESTVFFADPQTNLIAKAEYSGIDSETGEPSLQTTEYDDYRPVSNSMEPFHVTQFSGDKKRMETTIKTIEPVANLDEKLLTMPAPTEVASLKNGSASIPFDFINDKIIVTVHINGGRDQRFVIDTGSSQTVIDKSIATELGGTASPSYSVTAGGKSVPMGFATLPRIALGNLTITEMPVLITDLASSSRGITGLIGANILRRFAVTFDFDNRIITFADPNAIEVAPGSAVVPISPAFGGNQMVVKATINDKIAANFLLDTGSSFNNLPRTAGKAAFSGPLLPTARVSGIDGQHIDTGSVRLRSLKIGTMSLPAPVFRMIVDGPREESGLLTSDTLGILGNPVWSQFKTTLDYRNERIILEPKPGHEEFVRFSDELDAVDKALLQSKNIDAALKSYRKIFAAAEQKQLKAVAALALARIANCYGELFNTNKDAKWLTEAGRAYERAQKLASEARNRSVEGQVLAQWGLLYLNSPRSQDDITAAQNLINKAQRKAPLEPSILAAFGTMMLRQGKKAEANTFLNTALALDPSNWQALWSKYKLSQEDDKKNEQELTASQLAYYYPGLPEVTAISKDLSAPNDSPTKRHTHKHHH